MSTTVTTSGLSPYVKYLIPAIVALIALLDYFAQPANQTLTLPVVIGAALLVLTLLLHDLEGTTTTTTQSSVAQKV